MNDPAMEDQQIREALLQAAMEEFSAVCGAEPVAVFSEKYQRWENRFLSNPLAFAKKKLRPTWKRVLRTAACVLLAATLSLGTLFATNAQARAFILRWITEIYSTHVTYRFTGVQLPTEALRHWQATYLPEGYEQTEFIELGAMGSVLYNNDDPEMEIELSYQLLAEGGGEGLDNERHIITSVRINGLPGYLFTATDGGQNMLIWFDEENHHSLLLMSRISCDTLIRIAEGVEMVENPSK